MFQIGLKFYKNETNRKQHNETNENDTNGRHLVSKTSFSIKRNKRIANSFLVEHNQMFKTKYDKLLKNINRYLKITGVSLLVSYFSLIAFSAIVYTTSKQTTGYKCLGCPSGLYYNIATGTCVDCTSSQYWNGSMCVNYNSQPGINNDHPIEKKCDLDWVVSIEDI